MQFSCCMFFFHVQNLASSLSTNHLLVELGCTGSALDANKEYLGAQPTIRKKLHCSSSLFAVSYFAARLQTRVAALATAMFHKWTCTHVGTEAPVGRTRCNDRER